MAQQAGPIRLTGTIDGLTFYVLNGKYYVRAKSSLNRSVFRSRKSFERSRVRAAQFGGAARLASIVYRTLARSERRHGLMGELTSIAFKLLQGEDKSNEEIKAVLLQWLQEELLQAVKPKEEQKVVVLTREQPIQVTVLPGSKPQQEQVARTREPVPVSAPNQKQLLSRWRVIGTGQLSYPSKSGRKYCFEGKGLGKGKGGLSKGKAGVRESWLPEG